MKDHSDASNALFGMGRPHNRAGPGQRKAAGREQTRRDGHIHFHSTCRPSIYRKPFAGATDSRAPLPRARTLRGELAENAIRKDFAPRASFTGKARRRRAVSPIKGPTGRTIRPVAKRLSPIWAAIDSIRLAVEPIEKAAAKERMSEGGKGAKVSQPSRVTDKIGAFAGISGRTVEKIAAVCEAAKNYQRDDFALSEAVAIKRSIEPKVKEEAKERQKRRPVCSGKLPEQLDKAEVVVAAAEADPERLGHHVEEIAFGEASENVARKSFTRSEEVAIKKLVEPRIAAEAKERQGTRTDKHPVNFTEGSEGEARDKVAAFIGISWLTLERAEAVT